MLDRAVHARIPALWVAADEVYGSDSKFKMFLETRGLNDVVTISCQQRLFLNDAHGRVDEHVEALRSKAWKKLSCGSGTKGNRVYEWAFVPFRIPTAAGKRKGLLVRRSRKDQTDIAYYFALARARTRLQSLVNVAECRSLSRNISSTPTRKPDWTNTNFVVGMRGIGTLRCRCSLMRYSACFVARPICRTLKKAT